MSAKNLKNHLKSDFFESLNPMQNFITLIVATMFCLQHSDQLGYWYSSLPATPKGSTHTLLRLKPWVGGGSKSVLHDIWTAPFRLGSQEDIWLLGEEQSSCHWYLLQLLQNFPRSQIILGWTLCYGPEKRIKQKRFFWKKTVNNLIHSQMTVAENMILQLLYFEVQY